MPKIEHDLFHLNSIIKKGQITIDVGANVGMYSVMLSRLVGKNGLVLSFEPMSETFHFLNRTINGKLRKLPNVKIFQKALGNKVGKVSLAYTLGNDDRISDPLTRIKDINGNVDITTLDSFVSDLALSDIDFIKVDIEGYEMEFFKGSKEVLTKYHPLILTEIDQKWLMRYNSSVNDIYDFLESLGYKAFRLVNSTLSQVTERSEGNIYFRWIRNDQS